MEEEFYEIENRDITSIYPLRQIPNFVLNKLLKKIIAMFKNGINVSEIYDYLLYDYKLSVDLARYFVEQASTIIHLSSLSKDDLKKEIMMYKQKGMWWESIEDFYNEFEEMISIKNEIEKEIGGKA